MRERELKPPRPQGLRRSGESLPMRERELKPCAGRGRGGGGESLPMRERELKLLVAALRAVVIGRSPCGSVN